MKTILMMKRIMKIRKMNKKKSNPEIKIKLLTNASKKRSKIKIIKKIIKVAQRHCNKINYKDCMMTIKYYFITKIKNCRKELSHYPLLILFYTLIRHHYIEYLPCKRANHQLTRQGAC